ncbi:helix-turn-helix transcriptional regulator [Azospirillum sp.]|uniref:helix-turn-helix transcriptional regulator n=1 Tax=Azospirillum sp. TaxID=34012 RepID=UPI003D70EEF3
MIPTLEQRRLLGAFLRAHRERLTPADAGIQGGPVRRRTPGLRREEVAHLCGLSPTWYTWIEQGRDVSVSPAALSRMAEALRLTAAERAYLFELARRRDPADGSAPVDAPAALLAAVESVTAPAYVLDRLWQACAWNDPAARLFGGWLGGPDRNLLRYVFLDPAARDFIDDWENRARRLLAEFRADTGRRADDSGLQDLTEELRRRSQMFARFWDDHGVLEREGGVRTFNHPADGLVRYEQVTLIPAGRSDCKLVMLLGPMA